MTNPAEQDWGWVEIEGEAPLLDDLSECIREALRGRNARYHVRLDAVGRCGEIIVRIEGARGACRCCSSAAS